MELPAQTVDSLWQQITIIEAQEQLKMFRAMDWPNLKKSEREKEHKRLFKIAYPKELRQSESISPGALQSLINSGG